MFPQSSWIFFKKEKLTPSGKKILPSKETFPIRRITSKRKTKPWPLCYLEGFIMNTGKFIPIIHLGKHEDGIALEVVTSLVTPDPLTNNFLFLHSNRTNNFDSLVYYAQIKIYLHGYLLIHVFRTMSFLVLKNINHIWEIKSTHLLTIFSMTCSNPTVTWFPSRRKT